MANIIIGIVSGSISGFLTSYYFWKQDRKIHRPRLFLEELSNSRSIYFINKGNTFAENIKVDINGKKSSFDSALAPLDTFQCGRINVSEDVIVGIEYQDVFRKKYVDAWVVHEDEKFGSLSIARLD